MEGFKGQSSRLMHAEIIVSPIQLQRKRTFEKLGACVRKTQGMHLKSSRHAFEKLGACVRKRLKRSIALQLDGTDYKPSFKPSPALPPPPRFPTLLNTYPPPNKSERQNTCAQSPNLNIGLQKHQHQLRIVLGRGIMEYFTTWWNGIRVEQILNYESTL